MGPNKVKQGILLGVVLMTKFYDAPDFSQGGHWEQGPYGWWRTEDVSPGEYAIDVGVPNPAIAEREALLRVVRAAKLVIEAYDAWPEEPYGKVGLRRDAYFEAVEALPEHLKE